MQHSTSACSSAAKNYTLVHAYLAEIQSQFSQKRSAICKIIEFYIFVLFWPVKSAPKGFATCSETLCIHGVNYIVAYVRNKERINYLHVSIFLSKIEFCIAFIWWFPIINTNFISLLQVDDFVILLQMNAPRVQVSFAPKLHNP